MHEHILILGKFHEVLVESEFVSHKEVCYILECCLSDGQNFSETPAVSIFRLSRPGQPTCELERGGLEPRLLSVPMESGVQNGVFGFTSPKYSTSQFGSLFYPDYESYKFIRSNGFSVS